MKKYIGVAVLVISVFFLSARPTPTYAFSFSGVIHSIFGGTTVQHSNLGAMAAIPNTKVSSTPVTVTPSPVTKPTTVITGPAPLPAGCTATSAYSSTTGISCLATGLISGIPSVTVISPNGGETYQAGQKIMIKWLGTNFPRNGVVTAALENEGIVGGVTGLNTYVLSSAANTGSATMTIPSTIAPGSSYKLRVFCGINGSESYCASSPNSEDHSDATFTITAPVAACTINSFYADNTNIKQGQTTILHWSTTGASSVYISGLGLVSSSGSLSVSPYSSTTYTLTPNTTGCISSQSLTITVGTGSSSGVILTVNKDPNDTSDHTVSISQTATTANVKLGTFDLSAQGSALTIKGIPVRITSTSSNGNIISNSSLINTLRLYNSSGMQIDSEPVLSGSSSVDVGFKNLAISIPVGTTQVFTITGDINPLDGQTITAGTSVQVSIATPADQAAIDVYDSHYYEIPTVSGSYSSGKVYFYTNGINVTSTANGGTATASSIGGSQTHSIVTFTIPFSITAFGQNAYIPATAIAATSATGLHGVEFCVDNATGACQPVGTGVVVYTSTDNMTVDGNGNYMIPAGRTKNFMLQVTYNANGPASYRASLLNVNWNSTDSGSVYNTFVAGLKSNTFRTNYVTADGPTGSTGVLPAGCTTTAGYSSTTGQPCNSGTSTNSQAAQIAQLMNFPTGSNIHTDLGCNGTRYSTTSGAICDGTENDVSPAFTNDPTPRIMEWHSKVNQHIDAQGIWQTDPDGVSGAEIPALTYCKKWYPNTIAVSPYKTETISTWHEAGNVNNWRYTTTSQWCMQPAM